MQNSVAGTNAADSTASSSSVVLQPAEVDGSTAGFPITTNHFTGNSAFHHRVQTLEAYSGHRASVLSNSASIVRNWLAVGGIKSNEEPYQNPAVFVATSSSNASLTFYCDDNGFRCNALGSRVHFPPGTVLQPDSLDSHFASMDAWESLGSGEVDGENLYGSGTYTCNMGRERPGYIMCGDGGFYPFSGSGSAQDGDSVWSSGDAGGYAFGLFQITAQELLNYKNNRTPIAHALGMQVFCAANGGVYPSIIGRGGDSGDVCGVNAGSLPNVVYGDLLHLTSNANIKPNGSSLECQAILLALREYGAYTYDASRSYPANALMFENPIVETQAYGGSGSNPWYTKIEPDFIAHGEAMPGTSAGTGFQFSSCLQYVKSAADWEVIEINQSGARSLPPSEAPY